MAGLPINEFLTPPPSPARLAGGVRGGLGPPNKSQGGFPGGLGADSLRPGAIDQAEFKRLLLGQSAAKELAANPANLSPTNLSPANLRMPNSGVTIMRTSLPAQNPIAIADTSNARIPVSNGDSVPNLTPEQFAILVGSQETKVPSPQTMPASMAKSMVQPEMLQQAPDASPAVPVPAGSTQSRPEDAPNSDNRVVELSRMPDREERLALAIHGKRWHLKDTPGAKELFLGPDGEFGWDDFLDIINPLQHIPIISNIYRAITGDQAYSLSQFVGALPFGPLSIAGAVVDTIVRSQTGRDVGTDIAANVLGIDNRTPEEASLGLGGNAESQVAKATGIPNSQSYFGNTHDNDRGGDRGRA